MHTAILIVGQGICGTMLSWFLQKEGVEFLVIDEDEQYTSSKVAAGIINPVTGRRYVTTWMIDELMSFAKTTYSHLSDYLSLPLIYHRHIIDFFPSPQMRNAFVYRVNEDDTYVKAYPDQNFFNEDFNYEFGCGEISPAYMVDMNTLLQSWRNQLQSTGKIKNDKFDIAQLHLQKDGITYQNIKADKIIFCDGIASMKNNYFELLPFSANKGEALIIECEGLPSNYIFKKGLVLAPVPQKNLFWVGSDYQWEFENALPSNKFYSQSTSLLKQWLKKPFTVMDHMASIRPATLERRPFVGFHPAFPTIGILNGMGTKGASLAPYFANELVQHIVHNLPIADEANVNRFTKILSK